jgi:superfamily II DNA or RNA helicase
MDQTLSLPTISVNQITPRGYQIDGRENTFKAFAEGYRKVLIVLPTGAGKTIVFASIAARVVRKHRVLILCHREELIQQAAAKVALVTGIQPEIEKAEQTASLEAPIVIASVQSMHRRRTKYPEDHFGLVICDEAHHALSGEWQAVLKHFDAYARVLGVTATPHRGDRRNMGEYFEQIAFELPLFTLINDGFLSRILIESVPLGADLTPVSRSGGDFNAAQVDQALAPVLDKAAAAIAEKCRDRQTLVFLPLIRTSLEFKERLLKCGLRAEHVDGESENRKDILQRFERGEIQVLCNSSLLTEGYDCPSVSAVVILRPTRSRALYQQMVGRGTRVHPGKENLLLLDFIYQYERHDLIKPAHLVAKSDEEAEEISRGIATRYGLGESRAGCGCGP